MADEPYNISIETKAQLDEIQNLLAELRAINAEISKINGLTFSAVSASATELSKTGKDLAEALAANKKAFEDLPKATDKATDGVKKFGEETDKLKRSTKESENVFNGFYMELGAMGARLATRLPSAIASTIRAFGEEEVAVQKLSAAIRSNGGNVSDILPIMQQFASDMQKISGYGDEQILSMQGVATSMGVQSAQMEDVIKSAIGLSSALGMDLPTATKAASAAIQGKTELLTRYIPMLSECKSAEEKFAMVQKLSSNGFAQAEAASETLMGRLKAAANAWGDLQEVIGETFAPTAKAVLGLIQSICQTMTEHKTITKALTVALTSLAVGFAFTKVGGLASVSKLLLGVASSTKVTTGAMYALNTAVKANPIGLVASVATGAILAIGALADYFDNLKTAEEEETEAQEAARIARQKANADNKAATKILDDYDESVSRSAETTDATAARIAELSAEIESLSDRTKWNDGEQTQAAQKLVDKKRELAEVQDLYLKRVQEASNAEYQYASNRETERKYRVETELNAARKAGIAHVINFKAAELAVVEEAQKSLEIQRKYYADHSHLVKSEKDRIEIMSAAKNFAEMQLANMRQQSSIASEKAATEKWLNAQTEASKTNQRGLELDILRARASGNETLTKSKEAELRIAQLSAEIFENTRKEGMSQERLQQLQSDAIGKAQERYNLEKAVTDEAQRQNLAKNAQARIEDILLTNKIEQLKAEGKLSDAKLLEREREIKRTTAGLEGVSDEDKAKLAQTMRQTNSYKDKQQQKSREPASTQSTGGGGGGVESGGAFGGGGVGSASEAKAPRKPRAATVSSKNAALYEEWQAQGGSKSGTSWIDYRNQNGGFAGLSKSKTAENKAPSGLRIKQANAAIENIENRAGKMAGLGTPQKRPLPQATGKKAQATASVSDPALGAALAKTGADDKSAIPEKQQKFYDELLQKIDKVENVLDTIKNRTDALAIKKG